MKKIFYRIGIISWIFLIIILLMFLGNFIRNVWIIEKFFSAKETYEYNNNYKIDRLLNKQGETKQRNVIYNKDDKQRIDTYSWHGMSIHDKWRVDSSIVTTDNSEKLDYKNELFIDESKVNKKELIKQHLFEKIVSNNNDNYVIYYYEEIEGSDNVNYQIFSINKENFVIERYNDCEPTKIYYKDKFLVVEKSITYDVEFDTLTDEDLVEGEVYED